MELLHDLNECLQDCANHGLAYTYLKSAIQLCKPDFDFIVPSNPEPSPPGILCHLYDSAPSSGSLCLPNDACYAKLMELFDEQFRLEMEGRAAIPNVMTTDKPVSKHCLQQRRKLKELHRQWSTSARVALKAMKEREKRKWKQRRYRGFGIYPFLCLISDQDYVDIIINHLHLLPKSGEITLVTVDSLGGKVYSRYVLNYFLNTNSKEHLQNLYGSYLNLYFDKSGDSSVLRERWQLLERLSRRLMTDDRIMPWQNHWRSVVGAKLLEIMVSVFTVDVGGRNHKVPSAFFKGIPAVYNSYKPWGNRIHGMTIPHPAYHDLVSSAKSDLNFEPDLLPMVIPPLPWLNEHQGGFLVRPTNFVRKKYFSDLSEESSSRSKTFSYIADSLNVQSSVAWKVNSAVLDVQLQLFRDKGNERLKIAPLPLEVPVQYRNFKQQSPEQRRKLAATYYKLKKKRNEMNSLHADALYKFSIANHYRDKLIWLPHNVDFRGRSYPIPPHFNYMGKWPVIAIC